MGYIKPKTTPKNGGIAVLRDSFVKKIEILAMTVCEQVWVFQY